MQQNPYAKEKEPINTTKDKLEDYTASALRQGEEKIKSVVSDVEKKIKQGEEQLKHFVSAADKQLHQNPWPIVAGIAVSCLFLGFIMGTSRRSS